MIVLLGVGALLLVNGIIILVRKRYGPEEGLRGNCIRGKSAVIAGIILTVIGLVLILVSIMLPFK